MCGIVYSLNLSNKPVNKLIEKRYLEQRHRGTDGFGFYIPYEDRLTHNVREGRILSLLRRSKATEILFHHRYPSSTHNVRNSCHPFSTKNYFAHNYVGVHNGVIWNELELKDQHEKLFIDYTSEEEDGSFNDSEALIFDIARYIEGEVSYLTAEGTIAFIMVQRDKKGEAKALYFGRNAGNPLIIQKTKKTLTLASEGKGEMIEVNTLYRYDYKTGEITQKHLYIPSYTQPTKPTYQQVWQENNNGVWEDVGADDEFGLVSDVIRAENDRTAVSQYISDIATRLTDAADGDVHYAIQLGKNEMSKAQETEDDLYDRVERDNTATQDEIEQYYSAGDILYYLKEAVTQMERGISGENQIGFRFSPDHTYRSEYTDPLTEHAHYPFAD